MNNTTTKGQYVKNIFSKLAPKYDFINNIMSWGFVYYWRKKLIEIADLSNKSKIIDLCTGTGRVTKLLAREVPDAKIIGVDFCPEMIKKARNDLEEKDFSQIDFRIGNIMDLDLSSNSFDCALVAFGLRNVDNIDQSIQEMKRIVKPGGEIYCLELAKPRRPVFKEMYYVYFNNVLPFIGKTFYGKKDPYLYLTESLRQFLNQEELRQKFIDLGLKNVRYYELTGGITAVHRGDIPDEKEYR